MFTRYRPSRRLVLTHPAWTCHWDHSGCVSPTGTPCPIRPSSHPGRPHITGRNALGLRNPALRKEIGRGACYTKIQARPALPYGAVLLPGTRFRLRSRTLYDQMLWPNLGPRDRRRQPSVSLDSHGWEVVGCRRSRPRRLLGSGLQSVVLGLTACYIFIWDRARKPRAKEDANMYTSGGWCEKSHTNVRSSEAFPQKWRDTYMFVIGM
ncbi:hypothetical protein C2E23DRAFT_498584 [Lenzites betulinus]|nr:hypothetical protein C2E23DRAFT_498584 [Lenzites betulinus]